MKRNNIIIFLSTAVCLCLFGFSTFNHSLKKNKINTEIIEHFSMLPLSDTIHYTNEYPIKTIDASESKEPYTKVKQISSGQISPTYIDSEKYYQYCFTADIDFIKDTTIYSCNVPGQIILDKNNGIYSVKSFIEFESTLQKKYLELTNIQQSRAIQNSELIYQDTNFNIQFSYPSNYTYTHTSQLEEDTSSSTINIYPQDNNNNNIVINLSKSNEISTSNYSLIKENLELENGTVIDILKDSFKNDSVDITEYILVLKSFDNDPHITITIRTENSNLKDTTEALLTILQTIKKIS